MASLKDKFTLALVTQTRVFAH